MELGAAAAIVGIYGGAMYGYYKFLCWLEGPRRRVIQPGEHQTCIEPSFFDTSSLVNGNYTDEELLKELDLDLSILKHMEPDDRMKFVDAKLKGISIAKRKKLFRPLGHIQRTFFALFLFRYLTRVFRMFAILLPN